MRVNADSVPLHSWKIYRRNFFAICCQLLMRVAEIRRGPICLVPKTNFHKFNVCYLRGRSQTYPT